MRPPILVFDGGLRAYASRAAAERALGPRGPGRLDAFDASGRPLRLLDGGRGWLGLFHKAGVHLAPAAGSTAGHRETLRARLATALVQHGAAKPWADGAPLGALVAEAVRRLPG
ncbi:MAG: hypothetical protein ACLPJH_00450 [Myxococcaceae bacterium]